MLGLLPVFILYPVPRDPKSQTFFELKDFFGTKYGTPIDFYFSVQLAPFSFCDFVYGNIEVISASCESLGLRPI
jgi:hypothetical protein